MTNATLRSMQRRSPETLRAMAERGEADLRGAGAADLVRWAAEQFSERIIATQSMANTSLSTLIATIAPGIPVVFVDTGYHFPETMDTLERVRRRTGLTVVTVSSPLSVEEQNERFGPDLWNRNPDLCCSLRKVQPLEDVLAGSEAWLTGLRRGSADTRHDARPIAFDSTRNVVKISPLLDWSDADLAVFTAENGVDVCALMAQGYPSVGCRPCTRPVAPGEDPRAGRWSGFDKTECGIH